MSDLFTRLAERALGVSPAVMPPRPVVLARGGDASPAIGEQDAPDGSGITRASTGLAQAHAEPHVADRESSSERFSDHRAAEPGQPATLLMNESADIDTATRPSDGVGAGQDSRGNEQPPRRASSAVMPEAQAKARSAVQPQRSALEPARRNIGAMARRFGDAPPLPISVGRVEPPAINITIGRVEVRAERAAKDAHKGRVPSAPALETALTLSDYLRRDRRGQS